MKYQVGDIVNFNWKDGFFSGIISIYNYFYYKQSTATHSGIISRIEGNNVFIHEAILSKGGDFIEHEYSSEWLDNMVNEKIVTVRRALVPLKNVRKVCEDYEDIKYDVISIFLMPFKLAFNSTELMFCSEACARILYDCSDKQIDISAELGKSYEKITPQDLQITEQLESI